MKTKVFKEELEKQILRLNATIKEQEAIIKEESKRIRSSDDYNEDMEAQLQDILSGSDSKKSPLRVVR